MTVLLLVFFGDRHSWVAFWGCHPTVCFGVFERLETGCSPGYQGFDGFIFYMCLTPYGLYDGFFEHAVGFVEWSGLGVGWCVFFTL